MDICTGAGVPHDADNGMFDIVAGLAYELCAVAGWFTLGIAVSRTSELRGSLASAVSAASGVMLFGRGSAADGVGTAGAADVGWLLSLDVLLPLAPRALSPVMRLRRCRRACAAA